MCGVVFSKCCFMFIWVFFEVVMGVIGEDLVIIFLLLLYIDVVLMNIINVGVVWVNNVVINLYMEWVKLVRFGLCLFGGILRIIILLFVVLMSVFSGCFKLNNKGWIFWLVSCWVLDLLCVVLVMVKFDLKCLVI